MARVKGKKLRERKGVIVLMVIAAALLLFFLVQFILCQVAVQDGYKRLQGYAAKTIALSHGNVSYVDAGEGAVVLSVHGIFGGYDQAYETASDTLQNLNGDYRILAPSRFGYLGSDVRGDGSPKEQARVFAEFLDALQIDKVYLLGTSAGGSAAIRFALDYPERTKGLILISSAMPFDEKPESYAEYAGPPELLCGDYAMWLLRPFFGPMMGMDGDTVYSMLPIAERREGVVLDGKVTNPDMARNFDEYVIENLKAPTLVFQAKDDKMASYAQAEKAIPRFANCTFVVYETGGHLLRGHQQEGDAALESFFAENK